MSRIAYVDTSYLLAGALAEPSEHHVAHRLHDFVQLVSSRLLEAEFRSAFRRISKPPELAFLEMVEWADADHPLSSEIERVLEVDYLRGADCWHVATALYVTGGAPGATFLTLDLRQRAVAKKLGFRV